MSKTLADYFSEKAVDPHSVERLFSRLCLPIPLENEYLETSDRGAMVFLNRFGIVLRLSVPEWLEDPKEAKYRFDPVAHPDILQPIAAFDVGKLHAELLPGIKLGWNPSHAQALKETLEIDGIDFHDASRLSNYGYLPLNSKQHPDGIPVVLDRNAARRKSSQYYTSKLPDFPPTDLKAKFADAWMHPDEKQRMVNFWRECAQLKEKDVFVPGWRSDEFKGIPYYHIHGETAEARQIAFHYARSLKSHLQREGIALTQSNRSL